MKRFLEGGSSGSDRNAAAPTGEAAPTPRVGTEGDSHKLSLDEKRQQSEAAEARVKQLTPEQIRADLSCANGIDPAVGPNGAIVEGVLYRTKASSGQVGFVSHMSNVVRGRGSPVGHEDWAKVLRKRI